MIKQGESQSWTIALSHFTVSCCMLMMPGTRLGSDKYKLLSHWFDSTKVQTHDVRIPKPIKSGNRKLPLYLFGRLFNIRLVLALMPASHCPKVASRWTTKY